MDRNLGATTSDTELVGSMGLLYQGGRKDPFLGSSSMSDPVSAVSTGVWSVSSSYVKLLEYDPMVFYTDRDYLSNDPFWNSNKTVDDPCPSGWRVPDGGEDGIWAAAGISSNHPLENEYPAVSFIDSNNGQLSYYGFSYYWSATPSSAAGGIGSAHCYHFGDPASESSINAGLAVRCQKDVQK